MGFLDDVHFHEELENGVKLDSLELGFQKEPDTLAIEDAVRVLLQGLDEDINREGIRKTPVRVAKALLEGTRGYRQKAKDIVQGALFAEVGIGNRIGHAGGTGGLVIVRDLDLFSYCESCLLPFQVKCHVGYVPSGQRVVGLSKLSRVADVFAKRLQDPHRLADEVCSALHHGFKPSGVAVILECLHIQFPNLESVFLDSDHRGWVKVNVSSGSGVFENDNCEVWGDFMSLLKLGNVNLEGRDRRECPKKCWCPSQFSVCAKTSPMDPVDQRMIIAVSSILSSLGEDPSRKELVGTPSRFVRWLMKFQNVNLDMKLNDFVRGKMGSLKSNGEVCHAEDQFHSELNLSFWSQCEHHLLPFYGVVHIGYYSEEGLSPISKSVLHSIVHFYGFKLQVQERLTRQIAETVSTLIGGNVMVVVEANHTCMISRGIEKFGSSTATIAVLGRFSTEPAARSTFLQSIPTYSISGG